MGEGWPTDEDLIHAISIRLAKRQHGEQYEGYESSHSEAAADIADAVLALYAETQRRGEEETRWANRENALRKEIGQIIAAIRDGLATATARGWAEGVEQAAKVAESYIEPSRDGITDTGRIWRSATGQNVAADIRALERA